MPRPAKKRRKKKVHYRKVTFMLTARQKRSLENYCTARKTTPTRLIKMAIRKYIDNFSEDVPPKYFVRENQLELFGGSEASDHETARKVTS